MLGKREGVQQRGGQTAEAAWADADAEEPRHKTLGRQDVLGLCLGAVGHLAMMARGWDLFPSWLWVAYCLAYTGATAGLALWSRQGGGLGRRPWWRAAVVVLLRLEVFFLPLNRLMWAAFIEESPRWREGDFSPITNAFAFHGVLLGQSYGLLLLSLPFTLALPLAAELPLQLASLYVALGRGGQLCRSAALHNPVAAGLMHSVHGGLDVLGLLAAPVWTGGAAQAVGSEQECRRVVTMVQLTLGLLVAMLCVAYRECWRLLPAQRAQQQHWQQPQQESLEEKAPAAPRASSSGGRLEGMCPSSLARVAQPAAAASRGTAAISGVEAGLLRTAQAACGAVAGSPSLGLLAVSALWVGVRVTVA